MLGLGCCDRIFFRCGEWGLLSRCGVRASHDVASPVAESTRTSVALGGHLGSVVVAPGLESTAQ